MLIADVENMDLQGMHLMANPFATSFQLFAEAESNLDEDNTIDVTLGNWEVVTPKQSFKPKNADLACPDGYRYHPCVFPRRGFRDHPHGY